jgi:hypothetical protein
VKAHKVHLASDRTSCSKATANQFRLVLHTAAYWLLHTLRSLAPKRSFWRQAQFDTLRLALIKVAARVIPARRSDDGWKGRLRRASDARPPVILIRQHFVRPVSYRPHEVCTDRGSHG